MSAAAVASDATGRPSRSPGAEHVFPGPQWFALDVVDLARLVDPVFLTESGWNAVSTVLFPPSGHRLLGRPVCMAPGCAVTASQRSHICAGCQRRLAEP